MRVRVCAIAALVTMFALGATAQEELYIRDIVVEGGITLTVDTVSYYLGLEPEDPLDREAIVDGYRRLWDSGLFEDIRIEAENHGDGEVTLYIVVTERPFVTSVDFEGNKKLKTSDLKDKLDELSIEIPRNVPLRSSQLSRIEAAIKEIYDTEGFRSAQVTHEVSDVSPNKKKVVYLIDEGAKVKIKKISFVGNERFSNSKLRGVLEKTKQRGPRYFFGEKIVFTKDEWDEDRDNLRKFYGDRGYIDVKIGEPAIELVAKNPNAPTLKKKKYKMYLTIPIEEGPPYTLGTFGVTGVEVFNQEALTQSFNVKEGETYNRKVIDEGMERIRKSYHNSGHVYAYTNETRTRREGDEHIVDVTVDVFEGDRFQLGRLEFVGNTNTRDKVLRREFRISEGQYMNMGLFEASVYKVNALGYWKLEEDPLEFDFDDENKKVNVKVKGNEVGRNDVQFGAGYSELDGFFVQGQFNTRNFLGRGNSLGVSLQIGRRTDLYTLSYTEPYFLDRRILLGGSIFKTALDYSQSGFSSYQRETKGFTLSLGLGVGPFSSVSGILAFQDDYARFQTTNGGLAGDPTSGHDRPVDIPPVEGAIFERAFETYSGNTHSFTPMYAMDTRDDPFDPNRGHSFNGRLRLAGGPIGGDFDYVRPEFGYTQLLPLSRKSIFAYHMEGGQFLTYNDSEIPLFERYRLGGDRSLRGLPYYSVLPRTEDGEYFLTSGGSRKGGDRYWQVNVEYQFRIGGPIKLVLFVDMGNTYVEEQGWDFHLWRRTTGAEMRIFLPIFQAPIRFIYGYNLDPYPDEKDSDFQFSIGTTF
ncbi:MAG: outer membrane protein assembly factor BamA [Acidobacteria bacterium]|nr:outer membrane protein assembly factor BamA [Acidobacteriota bacterium]